jgi:hypothetical protein
LPLLVADLREGIHNLLVGNILDYYQESHLLVLMVVQLQKLMMQWEDQDMLNRPSTTCPEAPAVLALVQLELVQATTRLFDQTG